MSHKASKTKKVISQEFEEDYGMNSGGEDSNFDTSGEESEESEDDEDDNAEFEDEDRSDSQDEVEESDDSSDEEEDDEDAASKNVREYNCLLEAVNKLKGGLQSDDCYVLAYVNNVVKSSASSSRDAASSEWVTNTFSILDDVVQTKTSIIASGKDDKLACFFSGKRLADKYVKSECLKLSFRHDRAVNCVEVFHPKDSKYQNVDLETLKKSDVITITYHSVFHPLLLTICNINDAKNHLSPWYEKYSAEQISSTLLKSGEHVRKCFRAMA